MIRRTSGIPRGLLPAVFFVSFAAIGWQLALMRCLLIARYHHFSFLVISCALLGFGASGTLLSLVRDRVDGHSQSLFRWGLFGFALSMPLCFRLGEALPLNVYFPPLLIASTLGWWALYWLVQLVPFLLAGMLIGLALMTQKEKVHLVYGSNLAGSAAGSLGAIVLMGLVPANGLVIPFSLTVLASGLFLVRGMKRTPAVIYSTLTVAASVVLAAGLVLGIDRIFPLKIDQYKTLAYVQRLSDQGSATKVRSLHGPRGRIDLYSSPHFHTLLSLGSTETPPQMDILLRDGFQVGVLPYVGTKDHSAFLENILPALPYKLLNPKSVLILGASGAIQVRLAGLSPARSIVLVQPDANVIRMLRKHPTCPLNDPRIEVINTEPRAFVDKTTRKFDIIELAALEGFSPGSGGIGGLREDYLATVDGFERCLDALTDRGLACTVRGIQEPPRDNIKLLATWIEALRNRGIKNPGNCLLTARDELAMAILTGSKPLAHGLVERFLRTCKHMSLDTDWFPGVSSGQTNRVHVLPGPPGKKVSWYHNALERLLSRDNEKFYRNWMWNVRPARDDRPFFHDFFRWASLSKLRAAFGPLWPARSEMGFLVLILALLFTATVSLVLLGLPLVLFRARTRAASGVRSAAVLAYFGALGMGFMFLEMSFIQLFTRFLGDPILAAALILGGFLLFAGVGSMGQPRLTGSVPRGILGVTGLIACLVVADALMFPILFRETALLSEAWKAVLGLLIIAPLAILMGNPFPWGLAVLHRKDTGSIPLAWAVNGFASVVSASLAVILAMVFGFKIIVCVAALLYVFAGGVSCVLCTSDESALKS